MKNPRYQAQFKVLYRREWLDEAARNCMIREIARVVSGAHSASFGKACDDTFAMTIPCF